MTWMASAFTNAYVSTVNTYSIGLRSKSLYNLYILLLLLLLLCVNKETWTSNFIVSTLHSFPGDDDDGR